MNTCVPDRNTQFYVSCNTAAAFDRAMENIANQNTVYSKYLHTTEIEVKFWTRTLSNSSLLSDRRLSIVCQSWWAALSKKHTNWPMNMLSSLTFDAAPKEGFEEHGPLHDNSQNSAELASHCCLARIVWNLLASESCCYTGKNLRTLICTLFFSVILRRWNMKRKLTFLDWYW